MTAIGTLRIDARAAAGGYGIVKVDGRPAFLVFPRDVHGAAGADWPALDGRRVTVEGADPARAGLLD